MSYNYRKYALREVSERRRMIEVANTQKLGNTLRIRK